VVRLTSFFSRLLAAPASRRSRSTRRRAANSQRRRAEPSLAGGELLEQKHLLTVGVLSPVAQQTLPAASGGAVEVLLTNRFGLSDVVGTVVKIDTNAPRATPNFFVELFDSPAAAPVRATTATASNFLAYVDDGSFDRSIVHRSIPGFVIQGGGFAAPTAAANQPGGSPTSISAKGSVADEIGNPNQRGTIAMAKVAPPNASPIPNSATSQWFFNLADNTGLDNHFTAFGRVLGNGMSVVDALAAAPWYDASEYFVNGALTNLPLWDVPGDGIVRPQNFVTITDMSRAGIGHLLSYSVSTADPSLLQPSLVGDRLTLTRIGLLAGTTTVTIRASAVFDPTDFVDHSFQVTLPAVSATPDVTIEAQGQVTLARDWTGRLLANGQYVTSNATPVNFHQMASGGWTAVAAERVGGVNTVVLQHSSGSLHFWRLNDAWTVTSSDGWVAPQTTDFYNAETAFGTDFDRDGIIGTPITTLETAGSVTLAYDGAGNLLANGQLVIFNGVPFRHTTDPNAAWRAVTADVDRGVNTIVLKHSSGFLHFWRMDASWRQVSSDGWVAPGSAAFYATELAFDADLDGNGRVMIEAAGGVALSYDGSGNLRVNDAVVSFNGGPINYHGMVAAGWTAMAAEADQGVQTVVLKHSSGNLHFWRMDADWKQVSGDGWVAPGSTAFFVAEVTFGVDLDGDGVLTIETDGDVIFAYDADGNITANGTPVIFNGGAMSYYGMVAAGWRARAADIDRGVKTVVLEHSSGFLHFWRMDADWKQVSGDGWVAPSSQQFSAAEAAFGADLNGDGIRTVEAAGSVILTYDRVGQMRANGTSFIFNGGPFNYYGAVAAGWLIAAADVSAGQNTVVLRHAASGFLHFWRMAVGTWTQATADGWVAPGSAEFFATELAFGVDIDRNGIIGG
jgi:cyclophilin family peptidyl-prolyl cis-trans isomerase